NPLFPNCSATLTTNCIASYNILGNDPRRLGIDPTIQQQVLDLFPTPNNYTPGDGLNTAGYIYSGGRLDPQEDYVFKVDHRFNDNNTIFARYAWGAQDTGNDTTNPCERPVPGLPP